jgi:hypothetical protein
MNAADCEQMRVSTFPAFLLYFVVVAKWQTITGNHLDMTRDLNFVMLLNQKINATPKGLCLRIKFNYVC